MAGNGAISIQPQQVGISVRQPKGHLGGNGAVIGAGQFHHGTDTQGVDAHAVHGVTQAADLSPGARSPRSLVVDRDHNAAVFSGLFLHFIYGAGSHYTGAQHACSHRQRQSCGQKPLYNR